MATRCFAPIIVLILQTGCPASSEPTGDGEDATETDTGTSTGAVAATDTMSPDDTSTGADPDTTAGDDDDDTTGDDDDDTTGGDDDDDDTTGTTGSTVECGGSNRCVAAIPDPWLGPVARQVVDADGPLPDCGGAFMDTEPLTPYSGLQAEPYTCDCDCVDNDLACGGTARVRISHEALFVGQSPCDPGNGGPGGLLTVTLTAGVTQSYAEDEIEWDNGDHGVTVDMVDIEPAGACDAMPTEVPSPATWTNRALICGGQTAEGACGEDEVCVPDPALPYIGGVCIYRTGEFDCPDGYPDQEVYYNDFDDDRDCSECTCDTVAGSCGAATVDLVGWNISGGTTNPEILDAPNAFCQAVDGWTGGLPILANTMQSIATLDLDPGAFTPDDAMAPCPPVGGESEGNAVAADPVTVCCTD